ncbi:MAG: hypothetical protein KIT84_31765 [Labilithrix sp.]|nr:hypothetical protein [Labilithrix sp.]MCW5815648.1 hypothetical protein [Labilithrix sp.]
MGRFTSVVALLVAGCTSEKDGDGDVKDPPVTPVQEDTSFAEDGTDSNAADTDVQIVTSSLVSSAPGEVALANDLAAYPARCFTREPASGGDEVTFTFTSCQGRNGLRDVSGVVVAAATVEPGKLRLELTFTGLAVNGAKIDGSASTDIVASGTTRTMTWSASLSGTTAGGKSFSRQSTHKVSWSLGDACFALDGTSEGKVRDREIRTVIQDFRRCARGCPEAGGKITISTKDQQVSLEYDGTNRATFTGPNGGTAAIPLFCRP